MELSNFLRYIGDEEAHRNAEEEVKHRLLIGQTATCKAVAVFVDAPGHGTGLHVYATETDRPKTGVSRFGDWTLTEHRVVDGIGYFVTQTANGIEVLVPIEGQEAPMIVDGEVAVAIPEDQIAAAGQNVT